MLIPLYLLTAYLTYYTFMYARSIWQDGNKTGAAAVTVLAGSFVPLAVLIQFFG